MKIKIAIIINCYIFFIGCKSKTEKENALLIQCIEKNMHTQILTNEIKIKNWKKVQNAYPEYILQGEEAIEEMKKMKISIIRGDKIFSNDFKIEEKQKILKNIYGRSITDIDSIPKPHVTLTYPQKIKLFSALHLLNCGLTEIKSGHYCGFSIWENRAVLVSQERDNYTYIITSSNPEPMPVGTLTFHFKSKNKKTIRIPSIELHQEAWTIAIPKSEQVIAIEWNDTLPNYKMKRKFTWPDYNE